MHYLLSRSQLFLLILLINSTLSLTQQSNTCTVSGTGLVVGASSCTNVAFNTVTASTAYWNPPIGAGCSAGANDDSWWWFTATSNYTRIQYTSTNDAILHVFSTTCSTGMVPLSCANANTTGTETISIQTVIGQTYQVRIQRNGSNTNMTGQICVFNTTPPAPSNDNCAGSINLPLNSSSSCGSAIVGSVFGATNSGIAVSSCGGVADDDVWFNFTTTASQTNIELLIGNVIGSTVNIEVFTGTSCGSLGSVLSCSSSNSNLLLNGLNPSRTYFVRVFTTTGTGNQTTTFEICAVNSLRDDCSNARAFPNIPTNGTSVCLNQITTLGATNSNVSPNGFCNTNEGTPDDDIWFSFIASADRVLINSTFLGLSSQDINWQVLTGTCSSNMTSVFCSGIDGDFIVENLNIGQIYYIRMYTFSNASFTRQNLCLSVPQAPFNDDCSNAINIPVHGVLDDCALYGTMGTLTGASTSVELNSCSGNANDDVWYTFTANSTDLTIFTYDITGNDIIHSIYSGGTGSCGTNLNSIYCMDDPSNSHSIYNGFIVGQEYRIRVYSPGISPYLNDDFMVCVIEMPVSPPTNDDCNNAIPLTPSTTLSCSSPYSAITSRNSFSLDPSCVNNSVKPDDDVWFSFEATNESHIVNVSDIYLNVETYIGNCSGLSLISCEDRFLENLTIGNIYFVRVYNPSNGPNEIPFDICILTAPTCNSANNPPSDLCGNATDVNSFTGYCGSTLSTYTPDQFTVSCGSIENNSWLTFVASATSLVLDFWITGGRASCPIRIDGIQFSVYSGTCGSLVQLPFSCVNPTGGINTNDTYTISGLTIGQRYYLMIDGYDGHDCDYLFYPVSGILLPINITDFNLKNIENVVEIKWNTTNERNNDYFIIEKSSDGENWFELSIIDGAGTSYQKLNYEFTDSHPFLGDNYYRLNQVDFDGKLNVLNTDYIKVNALNKFQVYPNPSVKEFYIEGDKIFEQEIYAYNFDNSQKIKIEFEIISDNKIKVKNQNLKGIYFLQIISENQIETIKLVFL